MPTIETAECPFCKKDGQVEVTDEQHAQFKQWEKQLRGPFIQDGLSTWPAELREQLLTGVHPKCWEEFIGPDPDE